MSLNDFTVKPHTETVKPKVDGPRSGACVIGNHGGCTLPPCDCPCHRKNDDSLELSREATK